MLIQDSRPQQGLCGVDSLSSHGFLTRLQYQTWVQHQELGLKSPREELITDHPHSFHATVSQFVFLATHKHGAIYKTRYQPIKVEAKQPHPMSPLTFDGQFDRIEDQLGGKPPGIYQGLYRNVKRGILVSNQLHWAILWARL